MTRKLYIILLLLASSVATLAQAPAVNPKVPAKMTFADKEIEFTDTEMYERLDRELISFTCSPASMLMIIKRANRLFPLMSEILRSNDIPQDFLYLACIESNLEAEAYSSSKAAGIWQFMPTTAKEFGLVVNDEIDERYNTEKATQAACKYLRNAYSKYGNWESVAASYNTGMGRISNELASQGVESAYDLYLNKQTSRYIFRLLAMKLIMEEPAKYGYRLERDQLYQPCEYTEIEVSEPVKSWVDWANEHGITYRTLRVHNPWIRSKTLTNKEGRKYVVKIPTKESQSRKTHNLKTFNQNWIKTK